MIGRLTLVAILCWASPAAAMCDVLCASSVSSSPSTVRTVPQGARSHDHCRTHEGTAPPASHTHSTDGGCVCAAARLIAEAGPAGIDFSAAMLVAGPPPRSGAELLGVDDTGPSGAHAGEPPGLPLDAFAERNRPLLI